MSERSEFSKSVLSVNEVNKRFPEVEKYFADPSHRTAQLVNGERVMSAQEKIQLFGGAEHVQEIFQDYKGETLASMLILEACRQSPMVPLEIEAFARGLGKHIRLGSLYSNITDMSQGRTSEGVLLSVIPDMTYLKRDNPGWITVYEHYDGYQSTDNGQGRLIREITTNKGRKGLSSLWLPKPTRT